MHKFPTVDIKGSLIWLVGDAVPYSFAKHGLVAAHVIIHNVLKNWHESFWIDQVKVNLFMFLIKLLKLIEDDFLWFHQVSAKLVNH